MPSAAEACLRAVCVMAVCASCALCLKAVRIGPFVYSPADISFLVASPVSLGVVFLSRFLSAVGKACFAGGVAGFALGVACASSGLSVEPGFFLVSTSLLFGFVAGIPWIIGSLRVWSGRGRPRRGFRAALLFDSSSVRWRMRAGVLFAGAVGGQTSFFDPSPVRPRCCSRSHRRFRRAVSRIACPCVLPSSGILRRAICAAGNRSDEGLASRPSCFARHDDVLRFRCRKSALWSAARNRVRIGRVPVLRHPFGAGTPWRILWLCSRFDRNNVCSPGPGGSRWGD